MRVQSAPQHFRLNFDMSCSVRIVLVETSHPGNIGAVARAMMNMQLENLCLVNPRLFPHADATARASGAVGVLRNAVVVDSLAEALRGCTLVYGASARVRSIAWPLEDPRECAEHVASLDDDASVAIVFGRERTGLSNEELDLCHKMVHIPCNPGFSSLNVAAAVQVVSYELLMAGGQVPAAPQPDLEPGERGSTAEEMEMFHSHMERVMVETGFLDPENPRQLRRRLRRLFNRAAPSNTELNILRGILTSVEKRLT